MLHALLDTLPQTITFDTDPTHAHTTAAEAFALKRGVCQDISHIFIAARPQPRHSGALCVAAISTAPTA